MRHAVILFFFLLFLFPLRGEAALVNRTETNRVSSGLVAYWTFDGADLTPRVIDRTGRGNHGYLQGITATSSATRPGVLGQGIEFDRVNDFVTVPYAGIDFDRTDPHSISAWVKLKDDFPSGQAQSIMGRLTSIGEVFTLCDNTIATVCYANSFYFAMYSNAGSRGFLVSTPLNSFQPFYTKWTHVVLTYDGSSTPDGVKIYFNGVNQTLTTQSSALPLTTSIKPNVNWRIGDDYTNDYANGVFDEVRLYDKVLSQSEVTLLYNLGVPSTVNKSIHTRLTSGLVGHWSFDGPDTNFATMKVTDRAGNGTSGTMEGFATSSAVIGIQGQALEFNGIDSDILPGYNAAWNLPSNLTVSAWVRLTKTTAGTILRVSDSTSNSDVNDQYEIQVTGTTVKFTTADGSSVADVDVYTTTIPQNTWTFITCTMSGGVTKICYKDGVLISSATNDADTTLNTPTTAFIGTVRNIAGNDFFKGRMDDLRIYNRALSQAEITALYAMGVPSVANKSTNTRSTTGLVGLWSFDGPDMITNVADKSGQGHHGSMLNFTSTTTAVAAGKIGQGLKFDGVNDEVSIVSTSAISPPLVTVAAWVKASKGGVTTDIINKYGGSETTVDYILVMDAARRVYFYTGGTGASSGAISTTAITLNQWFHVVGVRDSTSTKIYINGVFEANAGIGSAPDQSSSALKFGAAVSGTRIFAGVLDDVRIYNRALSAAEISSLYNLGR